MNGKNVNLPEDSNSLQGFAVIHELHEAYPNSKTKKWPWVVIVLCLLLLLTFLVGIPWYLEARETEKFPQTLAGQVHVESRPTPQPEKPETDAPQTGDETDLTGWVLLTMAGAASLTAAVLGARRKAGRRR